MSTKKAPAKRRSDEPEVTPIQGWKRPAAPKPLTVPSGNVALVRRKPLEALWKQGMIPNSLLPLVQKAIKSGEKVKHEDVEAWTEEHMSDIVELIDRVVVDCVVKPKVAPVPLDDDGNEVPYEDRDQDKLYVDEVDDEDKAFIYQYVTGGTDDVARFRAEQATGLEIVPDGEDVDGSSEPAAGDQG